MALVVGAHLGLLAAVGASSSIARRAAEKGGHLSAPMSRAICRSTRGFSQIRDGETTTKIAFPC